MIESDKLTLAELSAKIIKGHELTLIEQSQLQFLLEKYPQSRIFLENIIKDQEVISPINLSNFDVEKEWQKFSFQEYTHKTSKIIYFINNYKFLISIASIFILIISISVYISTNNNSKNYIIKDSVYGHKNDVLPGKEGATLEIVGHKKVVLDDLKSNLIIANGITATDKELMYTVANNTENPTHRLNVPKRSTFFVTLSDGTKVWINSDSRLEYKVNFDKGERRVMLSGQAFFEVSKDPSRPFVVEGNGINIKVLGTSFDVNSYSNKSTVKLVEGKVSIQNLNSVVELNPGQQATGDANNLKFSKIEDLEEITAWRNGYFYFNGKNLAQILDDIARWYGIKVKWEKQANTKRYVGSISKQSTLAEVCNALEGLTIYKFTIDDDNLIIN